MTSSRVGLLPLCLVLNACAAAQVKRTTPPTVALTAEGGCRIDDRRGQGGVLPSADQLCAEVKKAVTQALRQAGYQVVEATAAEMNARVFATLLASAQETRLTVAVALSQRGEELERARHSVAAAPIASAIHDAAHAVADEVRTSPRVREAGLTPG